MKAESETFPKLLTANEVSALLGVSPGTLQVWRSTKRYPLKYLKIGGLVRYRESDLIEFMRGRVKGSGEYLSTDSQRRSR